ncbi:MAG: thiamine pyrophosphate-binding protein [Gemmatimonadales bacterium]
MLSGEQIAAMFAELGVTHVVTVPDSTIGRWGDAITRAGIRLVRVCREGEAWAVAGGLHMGGASPVVLIQCTGFFESGDSLRNFIHDWKLPIFAVIGYRSYLNQDTLPGDTCLVFTEPVLAAWKIKSCFVKSEAQLGEVRELYRSCRAAGEAGAVLIAEGKA